VLTADCLHVLFCDREGSTVAVAHAGWRGLASGILEATVDTLGLPPDAVMAWLGPAIGPNAFEVGEEVREAFVGRCRDCEQAFRPSRAGRWMADIYLLARHRLAMRGISDVYGGGRCTVGEPGRFFSYRRDGTTGRMTTLIWMKEV
jgi:YfiH family protein